MHPSTPVSHDSASIDPKQPKTRHSAASCVTVLNRTTRHFWLETNAALAASEGIAGRIPASVVAYMRNEGLMCGGEAATMRLMAY